MRPLNGELIYGRHGTINKLDELLESHHTPSKQWWKENPDIAHAMGYSVESMKNEKWAGNGLPAIMIEGVKTMGPPKVIADTRHHFTHSKSGGGSSIYKKYSPDDAIKFDIEDLIRIYKKDNNDILSADVKRKLNDYIDFIYNDPQFNKVFKNKPNIIELN